MRAVCQRVSRARVTVAAETVGQIGHGIVVLLGVARDDDNASAERMAGRVSRLRIFEDRDGKFARSVLDVAGAALVVSQFTLIADNKRQKGTRPDFSDAAPRDQAESLYNGFCEELAAAGVPVQRGRFGAYMALELVNDGPVTIVLDI
jgi:D-aminoacyl-tRNA deacylase